MSKPSKTSGGVALVGLSLASLAWGCGEDTTRLTGEPQDAPACVAAAQPHDLPAPSEGRAEYLGALRQFLSSFEYRDLGWCEDKGTVRDTGPYIDGLGYQGTHPPVHMAYSPEAMDWLLDGREGPMPEGTLIIKEQFYGLGDRSGLPAAAFAQLSRQELDELFQVEPETGVHAGWTTMYMDRGGSHDGWFWGEIYAGQEVDDEDSSEYFVNNFGSPCDRCHASTVTEHTFIDTENIAGFAGEPHTYEIQDGWQTAGPAPAPPSYETTREYQEFPLAFGQFQPDPQLDTAWLAQFDTIGEVPRSEVVELPPSPLDHAPHLGGEQYYVTANQCLGCHGGLQSSGQPMFVANPEGMGTDISPSGDWRFTPMGLAGRDPIFYAQLETEVAMVRADGASEAEVAAFEQGLTETCMGCHGGPGVRQAQLDGVTFQRDFTLIEDEQDPNFRYGALARDGINCTLCHHIDDVGTEAEFFEDYTTGRLPASPPGTIYGPYETDTLHPQPMEHGVVFTPEYGAHVADSPTASRLCGHCHTINLPVIDAPEAAGTPASAAFPVGFDDDSYPFPIHAEQATYTEWLNSEYQTLFEPSASARSCQSCHMDRSYQGSPIETVIASIQDESYPAIPHLLPDLQLMPRSEYGRHQFVGLNVVLLQLFNQFEDVLGVGKPNYMTGLSTGLANSIAQMLQQAGSSTVELAVSAQAMPRGSTAGSPVDNGEQEVVADVSLTNLTGHRFPSGVAFRRAFLELLLVDRSSGSVLWGSGRTNSSGVIVDGAGSVLPTEFFDGQQFQPHHEQVDSEDQVQIYEEIAFDANDRVTYSFLRRDEDPKDNRLLPKGWSAAGPSSTLSAAIIETTFPKGGAATDPAYGDGSGMDRVRYVIPIPTGVAANDTEVRATMYYQSTSPAFLREKFRWSGDQPATKRLHYLASHLNTEGTPVEGWKLPLVRATASIPAPQ